MTADELRELAERLTRHDETVTTVRQRAADFLLACADALDAGPVAVIHRNEAGQIYMQDAYCNAFDMSKHIGAKLYPVAMPAQAQPLRLPEPMAEDEHLN